MKALIEHRPREAHPPWRLLAGLVWSVLTLRRRSFARDAQAAIVRVRPQPVIIGVEHIPVRGPCLVTCNHFHHGNRGGWWTALLISAALAVHRAPEADRELHWVMTDAWTYPESTWKSRTFTPLSRWVFRRVARVYGFVSMPPMPPRPWELEARALAVLQTVRLARRLAQSGGMIGLAPEGRDVEEGLGDPPANAGRFIALLVEAGLPILPVGITEVAGQMRVTFGQLFHPKIPSEKEERDKAVSRQVMETLWELVSRSSQVEGAQ